MAASAIYEAVSSQRAALMSVCMAIVHYYTEDLRRGDCRSHVTVNSPIIMNSYRPSYGRGDIGTRLM
jgi:hypothetical protein